MKLSRLLGAVCACAFSALSNAAVIGPDDFGPNATVEEYENLGLPPSFSSPRVIGDDTYTFYPNYNSLSYTENNCVSGFCIGLRFSGTSIRIDLDSPVNRAGIYTSSGPYQPETFTVLDVDGNIIEETSTGVFVPGVAYFYGVEASGNEIATIIFEIHNRLVSSFDNLTTEITTVPLPASVWLFGSGLLGLVGMARRKKS